MAALLALILLTALPLWAAVPCYNPDGSLREGDYTPCSSSSTHSMCCATGKNVCRPDNLCYETAAGRFWRDSCTDPTWKDPACLQLCTEGFVSYPGYPQVNMTQFDIVVTLCGDGSYCCGSNATDCCNKLQGFWVRNNAVFPYSANPYAATVSSSASAASSSTSGASVSPTAAGGNCATAIAGGGQVPAATCHAAASVSRTVALGVGAGIGIPILVLLASILFLLASRDRKRAAARRGLVAQPHYPVINELAHAEPKEMPVSIDHTALRSELG